jgi:hypothetical protein
MNPPAGEIPALAQAGTKTEPDMILKGRWSGGQEMAYGLSILDGYARASAGQTMWSDRGNRRPRSSCGASETVERSVGTERRVVDLR